MPLLPAGCGVFGLAAAASALQLVVPGAGPAVTIPLAVSIGAASTVLGVLMKERLRMTREAREAGVKEGIEAKWRETVDHFNANSERLHEQTRLAIGEVRTELRAELTEHGQQDTQLFKEMRESTELQRQSVESLKYSVLSMSAIWERQSEDFRSATLASLAKKAQ